MRIEIPIWILFGSHDKFEFTPSPVFESKPDSNPDSIFLYNIYNWISYNIRNYYDIEDMLLYKLLWIAVCILTMVCYNYNP